MAQSSIGPPAFPRASDWRRAAHKCADLVYSRLSGHGAYLDTRVVYVAETGPRTNRQKRIAMMDSDGSNHRYLTQGKAVVDILAYRTSKALVSLLLLGITALSLGGIELLLSLGTVVVWVVITVALVRRYRARRAAA